MYLISQKSIVLAFICFSFLGKAQTNTIKGVVQSQTEPIEFASIRLLGTPFATITDAYGTFSLTEIPKGNYILEVSALSFDRYTKKISLNQLETKELKIDLLQNIQTTEEVVVTGTMKEVGKSSSPIAIEVYSPQFFKKQPSPSVFEALSMVNGVQPQLNCGVCNTGDIHINGMEGPYTMILIDGMPIVSSLSTVYGLNGIPTSLIRRIEVVKGPAATLYGSEAVGGLINIITKDPSQAPKLQLDLMTTSYQDVNMDVSAKAKIKKISALFGANYYTFKKRWDLNNDNFTDVALQDRLSLFSKWTLQRKHSRLASVAVRYVYEDRFGGDLGWKPSFRASDSIYGESIYTKRWEIIGSYQLPISAEKFTLHYSFNHHDQNSVYGIVSYQATQQTMFAQLLWDKKIGNRNDLLIGLPIRYILYDDNTAATQDSNTFNPSNIPSVTLLPGIFIQNELKVTEKFSALMGIRYDRHNVHGSIVSPRLSLKYAHNKNNTFRISGGNGYRVVNVFTEDHAALTGSREVVFLSNLQPEKSWNTNVNYVKFITHKKGYIGIDASLFYTYFTNKIIADYLTDPSKIIYDNLSGFAISRGATLNLDLSFTSGLKLIAGATLLDVYQMEENASTTLERTPQLFVPTLSGTYQLSYTFSKQKVSIDYTGRVTGPMHLPVLENDFRPSISPWFDIANIQLTKKYKTIELYGGVKNLWNFLPRNPILRPNDPFDKNVALNNPNGYTFDTTYNYASMQGFRGFLGVRWMIQ